jgi:hypothetical protein
MNYIGVFPLDVWRVILHFAATNFYDETYGFIGGYYSPLSYYICIFDFRRLFFAGWLNNMSRIHPRIRKMLKANTYRKNYTGFTLQRLY